MATYEMAGVAVVALAAQGELVRTWQQPVAMCEPGTWTLTTLPTAPPNDTA